jgi:hypothetical protein
MLVCRTDRLVRQSKAESIFFLVSVVILIADRLLFASSLEIVLILIFFLHQPSPEKVISLMVDARSLPHGPLDDALGLQRDRLDDRALILPEAASQLPFVPFRPTVPSGRVSD